MRCIRLIEKLTQRPASMVLRAECFEEERILQLLHKLMTEGGSIVIDDVETPIEPDPDWLAEAEQ